MPNRHDSIVEEIRNERERQIAREGWTENHDDTHHHNELAMAAACYAAGEPIYRLSLSEPEVYSAAWPWDADDNKRDRHPRRRQLVIAAALIVAEIERLDRATKR